ncbi:MAG TPA: CoA transferase [Frankiaceae bacterium]|nr:CoA transferase [Frankiaceae bacterium]
MSELTDLVVLDASTSLAGAYCAKLFAGAGASVTLLEPAEGAAMRRWTWDRQLRAGEDGALFRFLRHGQRSVTTASPALLSGADVVITSGPTRLGTPEEIAIAHPDLVVVSLTPYGLTGPYADRAATEFTVQADSGAVAIRGTADRPPFQMGGRVVEWVGGAYAAVGALASARRLTRTGVGDLLDVSLCEVANLTGNNFADLSANLAGRPPLTRPARTVELPSIEPTADGWVGFNTNTREQFNSFCLLIERADLLETDWWRIQTRQERAPEWNALVREWTTTHTTAEIVEQAALLRIPVAPVSDGEAALDIEQAVARGVFVRDASDAFSMPRRPWTIDDEPAPDPEPAPAIGQHDREPTAARAPRPAPGAPRTAPLDGIKVVDLTAWWAGPSSTAMLAALGADVIHIESARRMDGMRMAAAMFVGREQWWEYSGFFLSANTNKSDVTLDLGTVEGRALVLRLIEQADLVVENYTPRVLETFGLGWDVIHAANPRAVMVRMPAFGLTGPWRDRPGFAQTMEQITGLAWLTGFADDQPRIQRGPCDPNGGLHAAFSALVGLERRDRTGVGCLVEAPMFEAALNVAAEPVLEWTAYGNRVARDGNRSPAHAPQGLYACAGTEQWLAVSVATDEQWLRFADVIGHPEFAADPELRDLPGRRRQQDRLDAAIAAWAAPLDLAKAVDVLAAAGIPAAPATDPRRASDHPQLNARGFYEPVAHPVVGTQPTVGLPWRATGVERWILRPAPVLGEHNTDILGGRLGCSDEQLKSLEAAGVIGSWPVGL